ncbi:cytochrome P450 [Mucidula mucida]|nr:cytochrome P450 [Mucidula mucida]
MEALVLPLREFSLKLPLFFAVGAVIALLLYNKRYTNRLPLPPGPPGSLLSGNLHSAPKQLPWLAYTKWKDTYGPVVHLRTFGKSTIILNTAQAVQDLMEARATIYSDRPKSWMYGELCGRKLNVFWLPYDSPRFKVYRRLLHFGLSPRATQSYRSIMEYETRTLLQNLKKNPESFISHLRRNAGAMILNITYGHKVTTNDDYLLRLVEETFVISERRFQQPFMVDFFPWLRFIPEWFPFAGFQKLAKTYKNLATDKIPYSMAKEKIKTGQYTESFVSKLLDEESEEIAKVQSDLTEDLDMDNILQWVSGGLYVGGADTTVSAMTTFFYLMATHPEVQKKAQAEIDKVVGTDRTPTLDDREHLPYIVALVKEVNRWGPVVPRGLRHRVMQDDVYMGYLIPKDATIIPNIWGITHDPEMYPDPFKFDPTRHLGDAPQVNPFKFTFGFGRRVCPGQHFAEQSLFLNMANILAAFDIARAKDKDGRDIEPSRTWSTAVVSHLKPFNCSIVPRSRAVV